MKSIQLMQMLEEVDYSRRAFLSEITMRLAAAEFGVFSFVDSQLSHATSTGTTTIQPARAV